MKEKAFVVDIMENGFVLRTHTGKHFICNSVHDIGTVIMETLRIPSMYISNLSFDNSYIFREEDGS